MTTTLNIRNSAGLSLFHQRWMPEDTPTAIVLMIHGQGEHIGRYEHWAEHFNRIGIAFWGYDQQGFGKSEGKKGHAPNLNAYLSDIGALVDMARREYPDLPLILYGHSMGGNVALNYLLRTKDPRISAMIATSPWIRLVNNPPLVKVLAGRTLRGIWPTLTMPSEIDVHTISRDPEVVKKYQADPLVHDRVSSAAGMSLIDAADWLNTYSGPAPCRTLLVHGGEDKLTDPEGTVDFSLRLTGDVTLKIWNNLYHETHNEPEQQEVFNFMADWIFKR